MSELYKGSPVITKQKGSRGWERSKTSVEYKDYRFFEVGVSVKSEGIK